jgi:hypothetical protein
MEAHTATIVAVVVVVCGSAKVLGQPARDIGQQIGVHWFAQLVILIYGLIRVSEISWTGTGVLTCLAVGMCCSARRALHR